MTKDLEMADVMEPNEKDEKPAEKATVKEEAPAPTPREALATGKYFVSCLIVWS